VATVRSDAAPRGTSPAGHLGVWRAAAGLPAMAGSFGVMLLLFEWMGRWECLVLIGWLATTAAVTSQAGERIAIQVGFGFRRLTAPQAMTLCPLWSRALECCAMDPLEVDLYLRRSGESNLFAAGKRSVALTTGTLADHQARRLSDEQVVALLVHELGHHATRGTRFAFATAWLAAPWRLVARILKGIVFALGRRQPLAPLAVVGSTGVVVAVIRSAHAGHWAVAGVLVFVSAAAVLCPAADAAISRRCELAADQYAAAAGVGADLASALRILGTDGPCQQRIASRLLARHPVTSRRLSALAGASN
jgi:STE24 endopeptidase